MKGNRISAFTLLELLVAATISTLMLGLLAVVAQNVLKNYQRTQMDIVTSRDAEFSLDVLVADLEAMVSPLATDGEVLRAVIETVNGAPMMWLTLLTTATDRDADGQAGLPRAVSYRVAYQDPVTAGGDNPVYALYRTISDARSTFIEAMESPNHQSNYWASRTTTDLGDYLVGNVIEFQIRYLSGNGSSWQTLVSPGDEMLIKAPGASSNVGGSQIPLTVSVEVMVTVLSSQGAELLKAGAISREKAIAEYARSFTRRTAVPK